MWAATTFVLLTCAAGLASCTAYRLSAPELQGRAQDVKLGMIVVGVDRAGLSEGFRTDDVFIRRLRRSNLFRLVDYVDALSAQPQLLITSVTGAPAPDQVMRQLMRRGFQCFEPYLLVGTLGLVPSICNVDHELHVVFTTPDRSRSADVSIVYTERFVMGWAAMFLRLSSDWEGELGERQYGEILRSAIAGEARLLEALSSGAWDN